MVPKNLAYTPHQSRIFWLDILGRSYTGEDAKSLANSMGGVTTPEYLDPEFLDAKGLKGLVLPSLESQAKDEKKTIFNWEEHNIDDTSAVQGEFDANVATLTAGTEYTFTVLSTTKLRAGRIVRADNGTQIRVSEVVNSTSFKGYVLQNSFTSGSTIPGTDTAANGTALSDGDAYIILAPAQEVGGVPVDDEHTRPVQRRNAFQTVAYELKKTGHAQAEDTVHNTRTTTLEQRRMQLQYRAYCGIDDTFWYGKYGRQVLGTDEVYTMDGILPNIGTSQAVTAFGDGNATLDIDQFEEIMADATKISNPNDLVWTGNSTLSQIISKLGRANTTIQTEPGVTDFGTSYVKIHTHRGTCRYFELPESKTLYDTNNILRCFNTKFMVPVVRASRRLKWEMNVKKSGVQDQEFDVLRGDISLAMFHTTVHREYTGITG